MSGNTMRTVKPPIPPKPIHLLKPIQLPKPPDLSVERLGFSVGNFHDNYNAYPGEISSDIRGHDDYGYSEAAIGSNWDDEADSPVLNECLEFPLTKVNPEKQSATNNHTVLKRKEVPELVETGHVKDVRQRPLPLLPVEKVQLVANKPWYKVVDRRDGEQLVRNGVDGYFLVRPSSKGESCLTLTLWYNGRSYNIPIRRRPDGLYALGTPKDMEQSFNTIEDMIRNYQKEELVLYTHGVEAGRTTLKIYPA